MTILVPGQNVPLADTNCAWTLECGNNSFGEYAAAALMPVDDKRHPKGEAALFHVSRDWMEWSGEQEKIGCSLHWGKLPDGASRILLMVYTFSAAGPVRDLRSLRLRINEKIDFSLDLDKNGEAAIIIGEFYCRNGQWKFRALAEGTAYGLAAFGRRIGLSIDDAHPHRRSTSPDTSRSSSRATGTGFAVSAGHILTCAHVIEDMETFQITSFTGRHRAEPVIVDRPNDLALLRVQDAAAFRPVAFKEGPGCVLGESVVALGFPLAGLAGGGVHVTQGCVSALFGLHNDSSVLQFTAPIQPGSSGSPLFNDSGLVVGMVTSSVGVSEAQNMNFAVKAGLIMAFLEACGVTASGAPTGKTFTAAETAREAQPSLWLIEASNS